MDKNIFVTTLVAHKSWETQYFCSLTANFYLYEKWEKKKVLDSLKLSSVFQLDVKLPGSLLQLSLASFSATDDSCLQWKCYKSSSQIIHICCPPPATAATEPVMPLRSWQTPHTQSKGEWILDLYLPCCQNDNSEWKLILLIICWVTVR